MELRVLRYFLAVAREENITAAAESLHVTQPTLSKQLMDLEKELGKKLFVRGNRKIMLTDEGMFLRRRAQEIVDLTDKTEAELLASEEGMAGQICIGGGETEGMRLIAKTLRRMQCTYPGVRIHLFSGNGEDVAERLDKGLLDFGLFVGQADLHKYDYLHLPPSDTWGLLMKKDDPLAAKDSVSPSDLPGLPLLCSSQALEQNELSGWLGYDSDKLDIVATYNLINNAALMVEEGLGCALCIDSMLNLTGESKLTFKPFEPGITARLTLAWKKYQVFSKAAEKFLTMLQAEIA